MQYQRWNSRLRLSSETADPLPLAENKGLAYNGSLIGGQGFLLTPLQREELVSRNSLNAERIYPYLGGKEVNTSPTQDFDRYVINFGAMTLEEAGRWPDLLNIVREKVKPERDKLRNNPDGRRLRTFWWLLGRDRPALYAALRGLSRCLVTSMVSKHLVFAWQPANRVFSEALYVYPFEDNARFACLQSRIHEPWARLLSSSMRNDLRYAASDCFATFPFPRSDRITGALEAAGAALDSARARFMRTEGIGLTKTYNALRDPACRDGRVIELRRLHETIDREVLAAYGWGDLPVPAYDTEDPAWSAEIVDRLHELNAERSKE